MYENEQKIIIALIFLKWNFILHDNALSQEIKKNKALSEIAC